MTSAARIAVVVPALDAAGTLGAVLDGVRAVLPAAAIIVVDDGSGDGTAEVAAVAGATVLRFAHNHGKGAALRAGFQAARALGVDRVATVDADGQHDPACLPTLLAPLADHDVVVGRRRRGGSAMPWRRRVTNVLATAACSTMAGCVLHDAQSGCRAFRATVLDVVDARGDRYDFETDFLIQAGRAGLRVGSVPIATIYGAPSHFRELADAALVVRAILRAGLGRRAGGDRRKVSAVTG